MSANEFHVPLLYASAGGNDTNHVEHYENSNSKTFFKTFHLANKVKLEPREVTWISISTDSLDLKKSYCFQSEARNKHILCYDNMI